MSKPNEPVDDEDRAAFQEAMDGVQPLEDQRAAPYHRKRRPVPEEIQAEDEQADELHDLAIETGEFLEFRRPGIQNRLFHDLRRGVIDVEGNFLPCSYFPKSAGNLREQPFSRIWNDSELLQQLRQLFQCAAFDGIAG